MCCLRQLHLHLRGTTEAKVSCASRCQPRVSIGTLIDHELLWENNIMYSLNRVHTDSECKFNEPNWVAAVYMLSLMVEYFKTGPLLIRTFDTDYTLNVLKFRVPDHSRASFFIVGYRRFTVAKGWHSSVLKVGGCCLSCLKHIKICKWKIIHGKWEHDCYAHGGQWPVLYLNASSGMKCQNELWSSSYYLGQPN